MAHVLPRERLWRANFVEVKAPVLPRVCIRGRDVVIIPFNQVENWSAMGWNPHALTVTGEATHACTLLSQGEFDKVNTWG